MKSEIRLLAWTGSVEDLPMDSYQEFSLCLHMAESRERKALLSRYLEGHWSHHGSTTLLTSSNPNYLPEAPPAKTIKLESKTSTYEFWRNINVQFITCSICKDFDRTIL